MFIIFGMIFKAIFRCRLRSHFVNFGGVLERCCNISSLSEGLFSSLVVTFSVTRSGECFRPRLYMILGSNLESQIFKNPPWEAPQKTTKNGYPKSQPQAPKGLPARGEFDPWGVCFEACSWEGLQAFPEVDSARFWHHFRRILVGFS